MQKTKYHRNEKLGEKLDARAEDGEDGQLFEHFFLVFVSLSRLVLATCGHCNDFILMKWICRVVAVHCSLLLIQKCGLRVLNKRT